MSVGQRLYRALFVALAVGLGWGIRGDFGHVIGAMLPGAALGLGFAYVTGQRSMFKWMPILGLLAGLGISTGGMMSYGILHGYAKSDTFINYSYGFFTLVLQGGAWGVFGCALVGLVLEEERLKAREWAGAVLTVFLSGIAVYHLVVCLAGFHINPPRSDLSIGFTGGAIGLFVWLIRHKKRLGLKAAMLGYIGFGLGMAGGRFLGNASYLQPFPVNHWNVMEVSCGFIGGLVFTFGMLGRRFPEPRPPKRFPWVAACGMVYAVALIPLLHRLARIRPAEKLAAWAKSLESYGYENPEFLSERILLGLNLVCVAGFIAAGVGIWLYLRDKERLAAFPVMALSLLLLLFQNLNALYFFYPRREGTINMHFVFWVLYGLMVLYVLLPHKRELTDPDETAARVPWVRWIAGAVAAYLLIIVLAGFVNGEKTMASANTRFPLWSWRDGPPPR